MSCAFAFLPSGVEGLLCGSELLVEGDTAIRFPLHEALGQEPLAVRQYRLKGMHRGRAAEVTEA